MADKSKINFVPGESPLPGLQVEAFLLYSHMMEKGKESKLSHVFSYKGTNIIMNAPPS